jgi:glucose/arabinose dehydrogenase
MLYIGSGDGGSAGDPFGNGQRLDTLLGKVLRIDVDHPANGEAYGVPAGNPFVGRSGAKPEIWEYGLRNPWRLSFDTATGDLWIGDVGQNAWEEIDRAPAGKGGLNFGWNVMEGRHCYPPGTSCGQDGFTMPVAEYGHDEGCTVIGGYVYRGSASPALVGGYLFADYCNGRIFAIPASAQDATPATVAESGRAISSFGRDAAGELYVTDLNSGELLRVVGTRR